MQIRYGPAPVNMNSGQDPPNVCLVWGRRYYAFVHPTDWCDSEYVLPILRAPLPALKPLREEPLLKVLLKRKLESFVWETYKLQTKGSFSSSDAVRLHMKHRQHFCAPPKHEHSQLRTVHPSHATQAAPMAANIESCASGCRQTI